MSAALSRGRRWAFAGGGTGGHIVPGLHLLAHLDARGVELEDLVWFTSGRAVEERVFEEGTAEGPRPGLARVPLPLEPQGGGAPSLARLAARLAPTAWRARRALLAHRSEVVLGLGGFTSAPAILAARSLGLPAFLLEINAVAGRATRLLAPLCRRVFHGFEASVPAGSARHVHTGPPLDPRLAPRSADPAALRAARERVAALHGAGADPERPLLVVLGGSQGALGLNAFLASHDRELAAAGVEVVHQVGPGRLGEAAPQRPGYVAVEYAADVPALLQAATLVLCRGGASTLAEVAAVGVPAWVVPYPHHPDQHQEHNARAIGGLFVVLERDLDQRCASELVRWLGPEGRAEREGLARALLAARLGEGAQRILAELGCR